MPYDDELDFRLTVTYDDEFGNTYIYVETSGEMIIPMYPVAVPEMQLISTSTWIVNGEHQLNFDLTNIGNGEAYNVTCALINMDAAY